MPIRDTALLVGVAFIGLALIAFIGYLRGVEHDLVYFGPISALAGGFALGYWVGTGETGDDDRRSS